VQYAHPSLEPILKRTLGVPLFSGTVAADCHGRRGIYGRAGGKELRRALGFKRSERRIEAGRSAVARGKWARQGITGEAADQIALSIRLRFAFVRIFPNRTRPSFALLGLRECVFEGALPRSVFYTALPQQSADGVSTIPRRW